jgi:hypothetical protein
MNNLSVWINVGDYMPDSKYIGRNAFEYGTEFLVRGRYVLETVEFENIDSV